MFYTQNTLDRADHLRKDKEALDALWQRIDARIVPVWNNLSLVTKIDLNQPPQALFLNPGDSVPKGQSIFLGLEGEIPFFAVDVSALNDEDSATLSGLAKDRSGTSRVGEFKDLRQTGPALSSQDGSLLAYSRGLIFWNSNTAFCTCCGDSMTTSNGGHVRKCTHSDCSYVAFPRTDPAVIMLVTYSPPDGGEDLCLLGRSPNWPDGVFSTLAGFVEPGESLEAAVQREVLEEVSVHTENVRYVASQPWPFPRSIMLGFEAVATTTAIRCDPDEIADAQWFTREQLKGFGNWGDDAAGNKLPRPDSIARFLIDRWVKNSPA
ncbi:MAG: NAD+ diphosphatase [Porticoccaceae bacterium]|jgi:NAD+ diphosphatase